MKKAGHIYQNRFTKEFGYCLGKVVTDRICLRCKDPERDVGVHPWIFPLIWKRVTKVPQGKWAGLNDF